MSALLKNWNLTRFIRLAAGLGSGVYAIVSKDYIFLLLAGMFLLQAALNVSCCGAGGCHTDNTKRTKQLYKNNIETYNPNR